MILGFKTVFPWGEKTFFPEKIIACSNLYLSQHEKDHGFDLEDIPKLHTIREGQRFKAGDWLHMATGVRTSKYNQFNKGIEHLAKCRSVQRIDIVFRSPFVRMIFIDKKFMYLERHDLPFPYEKNGPWFLDFIRNDGFDSVEQFWKWFKKPIRNGQIIHWTDKKY